MHLVAMLLVTLLKEHVFEDVEQVVDALRVQLRICVLVCIQVVFGSAKGLFGL